MAGGEKEEAEMLFSKDAYSLCISLAFCPIPPQLTRAPRSLRIWRFFGVFFFCGSESKSCSCAKAEPR